VLRGSLERQVMTAIASLSAEWSSAGRLCPKKHLLFECHKPSAHFNPELLSRSELQGRWFLGGVVPEKGEDISFAERNAPQQKALGAFKRAAPLYIVSDHCFHRNLRSIRNNIIEQDHRAIKRRVKAKQGFREFQAARRTIQGYEAMHIIRKGQVRWLSGSDVRRQNRFINELFEVAG
jgi:hypothetical protein